MLNSEAAQTGESQSDAPLLLIVDDDPLILATLTIGLAQSGYRILEANSGEQALVLCEQHHPNLAILDIHMGGMSGIDTAKQIYQQFHIPFLFLTAVTEQNTVSSAVREGALGFLSQLDNELAALQRRRFCSYFSLAVLVTLKS